jgi:hypothetical protein
VSRERVAVVSTKNVFESAKRQREVFYGKPARNPHELSFEWPRFWMHLGQTNAEIYFSNKMLNGGKWELYKHVAEAPQNLFVNAAITQLVNDRAQAVVFREGNGRARSVRHAAGAPVEFSGRSYELTGPMPKFVSDLAEFKGVQVLATDGRYYEMRLPKATWASGKRPDTGETFLLVYSDEGVHFLVTGSEIDIKKDGIVG